MNSANAICFFFFFFFKNRATVSRKILGQFFSSAYPSLESSNLPSSDGSQLSSECSSPKVVFLVLMQVQFQVVGRPSSEPSGVPSSVPSAIIPSTDPSLFPSNAPSSEPTELLPSSFIAQFGTKFIIDE